MNILIVDDDAATLEAMRLVLEGRPDVVIRGARSGEEALEEIARQPPDLVLLDVVMPGLHGVSVLRRLKADALTGSLPVIVCSSLSDEEIVREVLAGGAAAYIVKPFTSSELLEGVRPCLKTGGHSPEGSAYVLLADDEEDVRAVLRGVLEAAGYAVTEARDGEAALAQAALARPDLVLLDVDMPLIDGWGVLSRLRSDAKFGRPSVLMLTSKGDVPNRVRGLELGAYDYIAKPFDARELLARVQACLRRSHAELEANPLSRLPGNTAIEAQIEARIRSHEKFAVLHADLNNFKALNDRYGFDRGDKVIREAARILLGASLPGDFVGHVGGDDFVVLTAAKNAVAYCRLVIANFNSRALDYYDETDRAKGFIEVRDRKGALDRFPPVAIAIGGVTNEHGPLISCAQIAALCAEMKSFAKKCPDGYALDRRGEGG